MNFSLYLAHDTPVHRLDGRTKVCTALGLFLLALCFSHPLYLAVVLGLVGGLLGSSRLQANFKKMWVLTALLFVYSVALWPFFVKGETPAPWLGRLGITLEGIMVGVAMGLRLLIMVWAGVWLLSTTRIEELTDALQQLGLPGHVSFAFSLAFRWVAILLGAGVGVVQAQRSRGLDVGSGGLIDRTRKYVPLVVPLIGQALRQTNHLAMALETKGFHPLAKRRFSSARTLDVRDYGVLLAVVLSVGMALWLRLKGFGLLDFHF